LRASVADHRSAETPCEYVLTVPKASVWLALAVHMYDAALRAWLSHVVDGESRDYVLSEVAG
jgi:hypothetical protein